MKAISLQEPFRVSVIDVPFPVRSPKEVLLKIRSVGICGSDINAYCNRGKKVYYPIILGHEIVGEVMEADPDSCFTPGDFVLLNPYLNCGTCYPCSIGSYNCCETLRVLGCSSTDGAMQEYFSYPENMLVKLPPTIDIASAPVAESLAIALHGLHRAGIHDNCSGINHVVIIGAGPIGILAALSAMHYGVTPVLLDLVDNRLDYASGLGIPYVANPMHENVTDKIKQITNGTMANAVLEMSGSNSAIRSSLEYASYRGTIAYTGWPSKETTMDTSLITLKELKIVGARTATTELEEAVQLISGKHIDPHAVISKIVPFSELPEAFHDQYEHPERYLKILAVCDE